MDTNTQKSLKKNAFYNFLKAFLNLAFPVITFPYASRILLPEALGKVNFANSVIDYFIIIADIGIGAYAAREAARIRDNKYELNKLAREIILINIFSTFAAYLGLFFSLCFVGKFVQYRLLLIVCSSKILFNTFGFNWLYTAEEDYKYITIRSAAVQVICIIMLFTMVHSPQDYLWYAGMGVFSNVGSNFFNLLYARKYLNLWQKSPVRPLRHMKHILIFFGEGCASKIHTALDSVMLGFMIGDISVGYYSAANKISRLVMALITAIISTLMPRSSYYLEKNEIAKYKEIIEKSISLTFFFSIPAAAGIFILCKPLILLFSGNAYLPAVPAMRIIAPMIVSVSFATLLNNTILMPQRKEKYSLYSQIMGAILNLILNYFFIKRWDFFGAAFATLIVETVIAVFLMIFSMPYLETNFLIKSIFQGLTGCCGMICVLLLIIYHVRSNFMQLLICIPSGALIYGIIMVLLKNQTAISLIRIFQKKFSAVK